MDSDNHFLRNELLLSVYEASEHCLVARVRGLRHAAAATLQGWFFLILAVATELPPLSAAACCACSTLPHTNPPLSASPPELIAFKAFRG